MSASEFRIKDAHHVYMVGICGMGMTALAQVLQGWGKTVSGSDTQEHFPTDEVLERLGIVVHHGFSAAHVPVDIDVAVVSSAYGTNHPEVIALREREVPTFEYAQALGIFFRQKRLIAVSGTHGKTTTTAMIGSVLQEAGMDPTVIVGAQVLGWGSNALVGKSDWVVLEADEYQDKFQYYNPEVLVITAIDWDHPDYFTDAQSYAQVFRRFAERVPKHGSIVAYTDDADVAEVVQNLSAPVLTYGRRHHRNMRIIEESQDHTEQRFYLLTNDRHSGLTGIRSDAGQASMTTHVGPFSLLLAGRHNVSNATAAICVAMNLGVSIESIRKGLKKFQGTERRMQVIGTMANGAIVIDDYAHHPVEVAATLSGLRSKYGAQPIHVVFQAHTYTRTQALLEEFAHCFGDADGVVITDIFASARERGMPHTVTAELFVERIGEFHPHVEYVPWAKLESMIRQKAQPQDVWVMMGAGDGWRLARALVTESQGDSPVGALRNSHAPAATGAPSRPTPTSTILSGSGLAQTVLVAPSESPHVTQALRALVSDEKQVEENVPLAKYTTFRIGGPARWLVKARSAEEIVAVARFANDQKIPLFLLSGGANILFSDTGFRGIVVKCEDRTLAIEGLRVVAGSGVPLLYLAQQIAQANLTGAEFCAAIPGAVGGAVRGNAGAFGGEMKDIVESVDIWDGKERRTLSNLECQFGYRTSAIKQHQTLPNLPFTQRGGADVVSSHLHKGEVRRGSPWIVLSATLELKTGDAKAAQERIKELLLKKSSSQSLEDPSAGCMFKNVVLPSDFWLDAQHARWRDMVPQEFIAKKILPAAWLIDHAELKGRKIGGTQVSLKHGNFIINNGNATAADVLMLVSIIKQKIRTLYGVQLEEEIEMVGF